MWDVPGVFRALWWPLQGVVGYTDPKHPELHPLHEWEFRSGLDRYVWIWGMACALAHPRAEKVLGWLDEQVGGLELCCRGGGFRGSESM